MSPKKIRPYYKENNQSSDPKKVYKVDVSPQQVEAGETVEILINCEKGFSVYIPYEGVFNAQVFEAEKNPLWAVDEDEKKTKAELQAASGSGDSDAEGATLEASKETLWGVRMTRIAKENESPVDEMPYCIHSKDLNNFAVANSPPVMGLKP
ncbi:MAG: hypothetical protein ABFS42_12295 [Candidatus Krumholzibacteriota bacterium]